MSKVFIVTLLLPAILGQNRRSRQEIRLISFNARGRSRGVLVVTSECMMAASGGGVMIQYVIERSVANAGTFTDQQLREDSLKSIETLAHLGPRIQWLYSYICEDKIYCVYLASDESIIREHARLAGIPVDRVSAVRRLLTPVDGAGVVTPPRTASPRPDRSH